MKKYFDDELQDIVGLLDHIAKILCAFPWMFSLLYQRKAKFKVKKSFCIERNKIDDINVEINYAIYLYYFSVLQAASTKLLFLLSMLFNT